MLLGAVIMLVIGGDGGRGGTWAGGCLTRGAGRREARLGHHVGRDRAGP